MTQSIHDPNVKIFQSDDQATEAAVRLGFPEHIIRSGSTGYSVRLYRDSRFWGVIGLGELPEKRTLTTVLVAA